MTENQNNRFYGRRASDWYIPFSLIATVIGVLVGVNSLLTPLFTAMVDINIKLTKLESQAHRLEKLEDKMNEVEKELYKSK